MDARWRPKEKMTSLFDSPTSTISLIVQKLFECIDLAGNLAPQFQNFGFSGVLTPKCNFVSTRPPKGTSLQQTASFEPPCVQIGSADWAVEAYKKKSKVRYSMKVEVIFHLSVGPPPADRFKPFLAHRVSSPTLSIVQNFILIG